MGRFAWTQNHHKQPSDGKHVLPDWFSKTSGEPSRQALTELVKEHRAHSPPGTTYTRSRTNTLASTPSRGHKSSSSKSSSQQSRPSSRQDSIEDSQTGPGAHEKAAKNFLSKGTKMMRRQTSKFNVLAAQLGEHASNNESNTKSVGIQRVKSAGHVLNMNSKRATLRPQISGPFDFQHVSHTDQSQYQNLNKATKVELADSFNALQADQQPQHAIRGIAVADIQPGSPANEMRPASPTFSIVPSVTEESPKPQPPPKDHLRLPSLGGDMRLSRSVENFSWPNRTSPLPGPEIELFDSDSIPGEDVSASEELVSSRDDAVNVEDQDTKDPLQPPQYLAPSPMLDKPLPQAPTIVHAVSTSDLSTLLMKTSPLPEPPRHQKQGSADTNYSIPESTTSSQKNPIRHMQSVPTDLGQYRRSQPSHEATLSSTFVSTSDVLASPPRALPSEKRISVGIKTIDVDDWEDAIDYSWDHAFDENDDEDGMMMNATSAMFKSDVLPQRSFPPMASFAQRAPRLPQPMRHHASEMSLRGLGINQTDRYSVVYNPDFDVRSSQRESLRVPYPQRVSGSPISKSSSQESIILSIASSIMSTHRSSNSSTSFGDLKQLSQIEDEDSSFPKISHDGSSSSGETVTTDQKSMDQIDEDTLVDLPNIHHQRGASTSRIPYVPNRRSSMTPAAKAAVRQRSSTLSGRPKPNPRASYSLFPSARPTPAPSQT